MESWNQLKLISCEVLFEERVDNLTDIFDLLIDVNAGKLRHILFHNHLLKVDLHILLSYLLLVLFHLLLEFFLLCCAFLVIGQFVLAYQSRPENLEGVSCSLSVGLRLEHPYRLLNMALNQTSLLLRLPVHLIEN